MEEFINALIMIKKNNYELFKYIKKQIELQVELKNNRIEIKKEASE